jgi:hypothetical protein
MESARDESDPYAQNGHTVDEYERKESIMRAIVLAAAVLLSMVEPAFGSELRLASGTVVPGIEQPVIFSFEELKVDVLSAPDRPSASKAVSDVWRLLRSGEEERTPLRPRLAEHPSPGSERLSFGKLPVGDYELQLAGSPRKLQFVVRDGTESPQLEIAALRLKARRTHPFAEAKPLLLKLRELEPSNPYVLEQLANRSIDQVPMEETLFWFQEASRLVQANAAAYEREHGRKLTPEEADRVRETLDRYSLFEKVFHFYKEHRDELRLSSASFWTPYGYVWVRRSDGHTLGFVDPTKEDMLVPITISIADPD